MKTLLNIFSHGFLCTCHGLCGNYKSVPDTFQCISQIFFTDRISSGCINIIYSPVCQLMQQCLCSFRINFLDRYPAKAHSGNPETGFSKCYIFHIFFSYFQSEIKNCHRILPMAVFISLHLSIRQNKQLVSS